MQSESWDLLRQTLAQRLSSGASLILAIDGRCGSGKTTLAEALRQEWGGRVFHTDDYYLPLRARRPDWERTPAANMDLARLRSEVLLPAAQGRTVTTQRYDCASGQLAEAVTVPPAQLTIVEGSYCLHPALRSFYDVTVFMTCSAETQRTRLMAREGERFAAFETRWIPLEEKYHKMYGIPDAAQFTLVTD